MFFRSFENYFKLVFPTFAIEDLIDYRHSKNVLIDCIIIFIKVVVKYNKMGITIDKNNIVASHFRELNSFLID